LEAGKIVYESVRRGFELIREAVTAGKSIGEYDVQQEIAGFLNARGLEADEPPLVATNAHCSDPHYSPVPKTSNPMRPGAFVLLDVFAKRKVPGAVYFDITWTGFVGESVPKKFVDVFEVVRNARDAAIACVRQARREGQELRGYEVDDAARGVIRQAGYGDYFIHRTGHSIGEDVHGNGANIDNFETHDDRKIISGTCFSIEPGIYLPEFGVRSEVNVYVEEREARVTGDIQQSLVPILAASV
jgi:Xaa-Pro aminopeptidase